MLNDIMMALLALLISLILVPFVAKLAIKIGAVDKPNERKVHTKIMPRMGGLAIYLSFFAVLFFCSQRTGFKTFLGGDGGNDWRYRPHGCAMTRRLRT